MAGSRANKPAEFLGDSNDRMRDFPADARQAAGFQLHRVERGKLPNNYKPMPSIGPGVMEIRIDVGSGAFRVLCVAKKANAIYVLHAFQKKTQKTSQRDIEIGKARYKELP